MAHQKSWGPIACWFWTTLVISMGGAQSALSKSEKSAARVDELAVIQNYEDFVAAQNARDVGLVRKFLSPAPDFQWVSDGKVFWGRETMLERMASFQKAPVWRVEPETHARRFVRLTNTSAYLYQPLTLVIGSATNPDRLQFLVNVVYTQGLDGWRIAALFTTLRKPE